MPRDKNIFTLNPTSIDMKRSVFPIKYQHKTSLNLGDLVPIYMKDILPGDTISLDLAHVIRTSSALVAPIMDNIYADVYFFFVPYRLVWEHWEQFCGANETTAWTQSNSYQIPAVEVETSSCVPGKIGNYLGIPNLASVSKKVSVSELPLRAVAKVYNDWFRDENSIDPVLYTIGDTAQTSGGITYLDDCFKVSRFHDMFSTCLPAPQKGGSVSLPLGDVAPLKVGTPLYNVGGYLRFDARNASNVSQLDTVSMLGIDGVIGDGHDKKVYAYGSGAPEGTANAVNTINLYADLSKATAATVNQVRMAFQLQKLLEKDARGGTRYIEMLMSHFGVRGNDARLQRAEYLCGHRFPIMIDQVVSHAETVDSSDDTLNPVGQVAAMSKTIGKNSMFTKSFVEHGLLLGFVVLRQDHTYSEGLEKYWTKRDRFDFYYPVLANIGEVPVYKSELTIRALTDVDGKAGTPVASGVFGYQEAWYEYRYQPSRATGFMNPSSANSLKEWTLGDVYSGSQSLGQTFLEETPSFLDRALSITSSANHQFICDFYFNGKQARIMPVYSIPGLIDHH